MFQSLNVVDGKYKCSQLAASDVNSVDIVLFPILIESHILRENARSWRAVVIEA